MTFAWNIQQSRHHSLCPLATHQFYAARGCSKGPRADRTRVQDWKSLEHLPLDAESAGSVLRAWVVGRVDVLDAAWTDEMDLDDSSFIARPTIVRMLGRVHPE